MLIKAQVYKQNMYKILYIQVIYIRKYEKEGSKNR